jgi:hypothetical protein
MTILVAKTDDQVAEERDEKEKGTMSEQKSPHVVLGTGPLGLAVARQLTPRGERVRAGFLTGYFWVMVYASVGVLVGVLVGIANSARRERRSALP